MANRLATSTSPYLLQHRENPVDWFPWSEDAFEKAKSEEKPVFLSVGYSSCHWCHVMAHEVFENEEIARILNENFICIKVDREERPDVDAAYMAAVQLSSGRGGWPMSVFLTPDKQPFFAGTYFPVEDRGQHPGFKTIATQIAKGWKSKKSEFTKAADEFTKALSQTLGRRPPQTFTKLGPELLQNAVQKLASEFDQANGGFGEAPKFPPHTSICFLLEYAVAPSSPDELAKTALTMALLTLEAMTMGGIFDHVGGGFHRYSTDSQWLLPHFEKMLYDNALVLSNLAKAMACTMEAEPDIAGFFGEIAMRTIDWLDREMRMPNGLYGSALDADSEGEEGRYYLWTEVEIRLALGLRADAFIEAYSILPHGNFADEATGKQTGQNIIVSADAQDGEFADCLQALLRARESRLKPSFDDKQIICWNALLIESFIVLGELERAQHMLSVILEAEKTHGRLPRQIGNGNASGDGFLEDHAALSLALAHLAIALEISEDSSAPKWWDEAERHAKAMIALFYDEENGGFFDTSNNHEFLFARTQPVFDQPVPSGNALALQALLKLGDLERVHKSLDRLVGWMEAAPQATEGLLVAAQRYLESIEPEDEAIAATETSQKEDTPKSLEVSVSLAAKEIVADSKGVGRGTIRIVVPEGFHINSSDPPAKWLIPTRVEIAPLEAKVDYPEPENDAYLGNVEIPFTVNLPGGENGADFEVTVSYQACTKDACQLAEEKRIAAVVIKTNRQG